MLDISEEDKRNANAVVEGATTFDPSAESAPALRAEIPTRRVGKVSVGRISELGTKLTSTPPRRRAASVFGTLGKEIVSYPARANSSILLDAAGLKELVGEQERETGIQHDAVMDARVREGNESESPHENPQTDDDAGAEIRGGRRIYVRFQELADDTRAAYIHVLMGLFADNPGDDVVALVFERAKEFIEIAVPNGVNYNEVSEVVQNIIGEDAVVEVIE